VFIESKPFNKINAFAKSIKPFNEMTAFMRVKKASDKDDVL